MSKKETALENTADDAYAIALFKVHRLLGNIETAIQEHARRQSMNPNDRRHVGDLDHLRDLLQPASEFLK